MNTRVPPCWLVCGSLFVAWIAAPAVAAEKIEIKYLVPTRDAARVDAIKKEMDLKKDAAATMEVYFFDTPKLALLGKGLALRLRKKDGAWEVTVKERPASKETVAKDERLERDKTVHQDAVVSYSLETTATDKVADKATRGDNSEDIRKLFSPQQIAFLGERVKWEEVRCFPVIKAKRWDLPDMKKLEAEEWNYDGQALLEFSVKAKAAEAASAEAEFIKVLAKHGFDSKKSGRLKTKTALEALKPKRK